MFICREVHVVMAFLISYNLLLLHGVMLRKCHDENQLTITHNQHINLT